MAAPAPDCSIPDSPTRAPAGWSLSLSRMRAQRAEEEQGLRGAAADGRQKMLSDREEGELPDTPPRKSVPATPSAVSMNDDLQEYRLKVAALENQVCSLRRANGDLARRLAAAEIEEGAAAENRPKAELAALQKKNEALQKEADVASAKVCFLRMVNAGSSETREHVEDEVFSLRKANADLTRRLAAAETFSAAAKSRHTEELAALKKKNDTLQRNVAEAMVKLSRLADSKATAASNVENLKKKVENQRQNLTNLQHTLMKYKGLQAATFLFQTKSEPVRECGTESGRGLSKDVCASCARLHDQIGILLGENATMKTRISNQTSALALKEAALKRVKNESAAKACSSTTAVAGQRRDLGSAPRPTATSAPQQQECMPMDESGAYPFEKKVFKVLLDVFPMAGNIMQSFEESSRSLTALRPAFRAAIAAMPPATRMLTTSKLGPMLPQPAALLAGAGPWTEDPALEGNDAALMAVFWGRRDACQLLGCKADARLWSQPLGAPGHRGGAAGPKREAPGTLADTPSAVARSAQRREASIAAPASGSPTHVPPVPERSECALLFSLYPHTPRGKRSRFLTFAISPAEPPLVPAPEAVWKTPVVPALEPVLKTPLVPAPEPVLLPPKPGPSKEAPLVRVTEAGIRSSTLGPRAGACSYAISSAGPEAGTRPGEIAALGPGARSQTSSVEPGFCGKSCAAGRRGRACPEDSACLRPAAGAPSGGVCLGTGA
ncbi:hypothetical protein ONE63_007336 [Megalurothrips usitatus]|uniref:Uncharacterized protein n=1 Tax=Megalurothrips usitatus TaxID=439358 RepID=A0AAV7XV69_9NEOP|nr:hypothetical protein ONE63_007336 [Megalurothrips usitatus]